MTGAAVQALRRLRTERLWLLAARAPASAAEALSLAETVAPAVAEASRAAPARGDEPAPAMARESNASPNKFL